MFWWKLELFFFSELEESLLWKLDSLGIKNFAIEYLPERSQEKTLLLWLASNEWNTQDKLDFESSLRDLIKPFEKNTFNLKWQKIVDEDWSSSWKKLWQADPVGEKLLILPSWLEVPECYSNRLILRLDPGSAFGTGSHPTTRLCLELLEKVPLMGKQVADIGCGSGILGIAALLLGAKEVKAVDVDSLAVRAAKENAELNDFNEAQLFVSLGSINDLLKEYQAQKADLLICNILLPVIKQLAPSFHLITSDDAELVLSGLLLAQVEYITSFLSEFNWQLIDSYTIDNWALIRLKRSSNFQQ